MVSRITEQNSEKQKNQLRVTIMNASAAVIPIVPAIQVARILYATDFSEASRRLYHWFLQ
jgi:hypothetical protein